MKCCGDFLKNKALFKIGDLWIPIDPSFFKPKHVEKLHVGD
jgi:hypothetical protein